MKRLWLLYLVLIFGLSSIPGNPKPEHRPIMRDKHAHFLLYAGLGFVYARFGGDPRASGRRILAQVLLIAAVTGLCDELYQVLVPERTLEAGDWIADLAGGFCGAIPGLRMRLTRSGREDGSTR